MKFTDRCYKRRVYISRRHVIMVDPITVISWVRPDLECDRHTETWRRQNLKLECIIIEGERKEGGRNIDSAKMEWVASDRNRGWRCMGRHWRGP